MKFVEPRGAFRLQQPGHGDVGRDGRRGDRVEERARRFLEELGGPRGPAEGAGRDQVEDSFGENEDLGPQRAEDGRQRLTLGVGRDDGDDRPGARLRTLLHGVRVADAAHGLDGRDELVAMMQVKREQCRFQVRQRGTFGDPIEPERVESDPANFHLMA